MHNFAIYFLSDTFYQNNLLQTFLKTRFSTPIPLPFKTTNLKFSHWPQQMGI